MLRIPGLSGEINHWRRRGKSNVGQASLLGLCLTLLVLLGTLWIWITRPHGHNVLVTRSETGQLLKAIRPAALGTGTSLGLRVGDQLTYRFKQRRIVRATGASFGAVISVGATNSAAGIVVRQEGDLVLRVYGKESAGWVVGFHLARGSIRLELEGASEQIGVEGPGLEDEILVRVAESGRIIGFAADHDLGAEVLQHWRDIASRWQTVLSDRVDARAWTVSEQDPTGVYDARYERVGANSSRLLLKEKQCYISIGTTSSADLSPETRIQSTSEIELDPYPIEIKGNEDLTIQAPALGGAVFSTAIFTLRLVAVEANAEVLSQASAMLEIAKAPDRAFSWAAGAAPKEQDDLGIGLDTTMETEIAKLRRILDSGGSGSVAELHVLENLVSLIRSDDLSVDTLVAALKQSTTATNAELASALVGMLGSAGTPKAQRALLGVLATEDWPLPFRELAGFSFAQVTAPIPEVDQCFERLHEQQGDLSDTSLLLLAAMGNRVRTSDPSRFCEITDYVLRAATTAVLDESRRIVGIDAIANLGPTEVPELIVDLVNNCDDVLLRARALSALKRIESTAADSLLASSLADISEEMRAAAVDLLEPGRGLSWLPSVRVAALNDPSEMVRLRAVGALGRWLDHEESVANVLEQIAAESNPQSDQVRRW